MRATRANPSDFSATSSFPLSVPPAKKITFFKSGDPQFGGVKMAINQRSFKSFNALMDDLSHRVPLPFGVRTITTPQGIHCISALDQLEDGGCYLCSDKKYVKPFSISTGRRVGSQWNGRPVSALRKGGQEGRREDHFAQQGPKIPKKITLVKNGDIGIRRTIILNHRNARSFKTLLDEISELLQFTVRKLYTVDGKKVSVCDTWCLLIISNKNQLPILFMPYKANSLAREKDENRNTSSAAQEIVCFSCTSEPQFWRRGEVVLQHSSGNRRRHCGSGQSSGSLSSPGCSKSKLVTPPTMRGQHAS
uniref:Doublecortin domain-containing protein n=1 Tax=Pelusios castaneus TaxID=367368 RepID=A0A8C8RPP6_9SAUR